MQFHKFSISSHFSKFLLRIDVKLKKKLILTKPALQDQNKLFIFGLLLFPNFSFKLNFIHSFWKLNKHHWYKTAPAQLKHLFFLQTRETSIELLLENSHVVHAVSYQILYQWIFKKKNVLGVLLQFWINDAISSLFIFFKA